ncbi:MAG: DUF4340 domain-containing protein [Deltaproteobacteria bacterium]|nr:DUF4340 domain-containing protein [Deltaproteobacteria bacterium]
MRRATLISLLVFGSLLVLVLLMLGQKAERGMRRMDLTQFDLAAVDHISIRGTNPIELAREGDLWRIAGRPANANSVKALLGSMEHMRSSDLLVDGGQDLSEYGLDEAQAQHVLLKGSGKKLAEFALGKATGGGAYVLVDEAVFLVRKVFPRTFGRKLSDWHELKLFDVKLDQVERMIIRPAEGAPWSLIKDDAAWRLEPKRDLRLDQDVVRRLVGGLVNARAGEIRLVDVNFAKAGLEKGYEVLRFEGKAGLSGELHLGAPSGENDVFAQVAGRDDLFVLRGYLAKNLRKVPEDLRSLKPMDLEPAKAVALQIRDGKAKLSLAKEEGAWRVLESSVEVPADFKLEAVMVEGRLRALVGAKGIEMVTGEAGSESGFGQAEISVSLLGGETVGMQIGKKIKRDKKELRIVQGNADDKLYLMPQRTVERLLGMLPSFKRPAMPPRPAGGMPGQIDPSVLEKLPPEVRAKILKQLGQR